MAPTVVTVTTTSGITGIADPAETAMDPANGNVLTNSGRTLILVDNTDSAAHWVTFKTSLTEQGLAVKHERVSVGGWRQGMVHGLHHDRVRVAAAGRCRLGADAACRAGPVNHHVDGDDRRGRVRGGSHLCEHLRGIGRVSERPGDHDRVNVDDHHPIARVGGGLERLVCVRDAGRRDNVHPAAGRRCADRAGHGLVLTAPPSSGGAAAPAGTALVKLKVIEPA